MNRSRLLSAVTKYQTAGQLIAGRKIAPFWTGTGLVIKVIGGMVVVVVVVLVVFDCMKTEIIGALIPLDCVTRNVT